MSDDSSSPASQYLESDLLTPPPKTVCELGTVGWPGDPVVFDLGSADNDGNTLIKVTLFAGAPTGSPASATGAANGHQYLCRLTWPLWLIPKAGQQCVVVFPGGLVEAPGAGVIVAFPGVSPLKQFNETTAKMDLSGYDLVIKARSITLRDEANNVLAVSPDGGIYMADATGSGIQIHDGKIMIKSVTKSGELRTAIALDPDVVQVIHAAGGSGAKWVGANVSVTGGNIALNYTAALALGVNASPATAVMVGPGPAPAAIASKSIFGSP